MLVKAGSDPRAEVIDGQQRLTTLSILFAVLRDLTENPKLAAELAKVVVEPGEILGRHSGQAAPDAAEAGRQVLRATESRPKAPPRPRCASTTLTSRRTPRRPSATTRSALRERLAAWPDDKRQRLAAMLGTRTFLVVVSTPDLNSAHRIFSVMNARGLDLTPSDIFKSKVIGDVTDQDAAEYADKWEQEEVDLGRDAFADLFGHVRMIFMKERASKVLLQEFDEQVLSKYLPGKATRVRRRRPHPVLRCLRAPADSELSRRRELVAGQQLAAPADAGRQRQLAAACAVGTEGPRQRPRLPRRRSCASWNVSQPACCCGASTPPREAPGTASCSSSSRRATGCPRRPSTSPRGAGGDQGPARRPTSTWSRPCASTSCSDSTTCSPSSPGVSYQHKMITVEHVLPQNPKDDSVWKQDFTDDQRLQWTHRLGNLVLLNRAKNSEAQNYDFAKKKAKYFTSANGSAVFALTTQVLTHD